MSHTESVGDEITFAPILCGRDKWAPPRCPVRLSARPSAGSERSPLRVRLSVRDVSVRIRVWIRGRMG